MRSNLITGATFAAGALAATLAFAQPPEGGQRPQGRGRYIPLIVEALDADKDGALSTEELGKASDAIKTLDKDSDGKVSGEEMRPRRPQGEGRPQNDSN